MYMAHNQYAKLCTKNHKNLCIFVKFIVKKSVAAFLCEHGVYCVVFMAVTAALMQLVRQQGL